MSASYEDLLNQYEEFYGLGTPFERIVAMRSEVQSLIGDTCRWYLKQEGIEFQCKRMIQELTELRVAVTDYRHILEGICMVEEPGRLNLGHE